MANGHPLRLASGRTVRHDAAVRVVGEQLRRAQGVRDRSQVSKRIIDAFVAVVLVRTEATRPPIVREFDRPQEPRHAATMRFAGVTAKGRKSRGWTCVAGPSVFRRMGAKQRSADRGTGNLESAERWAVSCWMRTGRPCGTPLGYPAGHRPCAPGQAPHATPLRGLRRR